MGAAGPLRGGRALSAKKLAETISKHAFLSYWYSIGLGRDPKLGLYTFCMGMGQGTLAMAIVVRSIRRHSGGGHAVHGLPRGRVAPGPVGGKGGVNA